MLSSFGAENDLLDSLLEVMQKHEITCEEIFLGLSERDIADLELSVRHRVLLRRAIVALASDKPAAVSGNTTLEQRHPCLLTWHRNSQPLRPFLAWVPTKLRARPTSLRSLRLPSSA